MKRQATIRGPIGSVFTCETCSTRATRARTTQRFCSEKCYEIRKHHRHRAARIQRSTEWRARRAHEKGCRRCLNDLEDSGAQTCGACRADRYLYRRRGY